MDRRPGYSMSNPFWDYSLASYSLEGVASGCLVLQDTCGMDVNLLLYAAWLAHMNQRLSGEHVAGVGAVIFEWQEKVVKPLRALRRQLQDYPPAVAVREEIKALELRAEQQQQALMYAFFQRTGDLPQAPRPLRENLVLVAQFACPQDAVWELTIDRLVPQFPL
jgi:uncharacterized protein (TIGR02444 family)